MASPTLQRPIKTGNVRSFTAQVQALAPNDAPILATEVDADIDLLVNAWNNPASTFAPGGPAGGSLTGNFPTPTIAASGVTAGSYGASDRVARVTINPEGRVTSATEVMIAPTGGAPGGPAGGSLSGNFPNPSLAASSVGTPQLQAGAVTNYNIGPLAVGTAQIGDGAITNDKIGALAVGTAQIGNGAVTNQKIATNAVGTAQIGPGAVGTGQIGAGAITNTLIGALAVGTAQIGDGAVTNQKIAANAVGTTQIGPGAVGTAQVGAGAITNALLAANAVGTGNIGTGAVTRDKLAVAAATQGGAVANVLSNFALTAANVWTPAASLFVTTRGGFVALNATHGLYAEVYAGVNGTFTLRLVRDGVPIANVSVNLAAGADAYFVPLPSLTWFDQPPAGGHTYVLEAIASVGNIRSNAATPPGYLQGLELS